MNKRAIADLRRLGLDARRSLDPEARRDASRRISNRVMRTHEFQAARTVGCYLPMPDEVDPSPVIARAWRMRKRVCVPVIDARSGMQFALLTPETRITRNRFGIWEPESAAHIPPRLLDIVITPLVAFDTACGRIGMGGGYFDRCFAYLKRRRLWRRPKLLGVAFDCQRVEKFELNPWDIRLSAVVTESRRHGCSP